EFIFLSIASLDINKNQNTLLEAFAEQFKNNKNIKLIIVGNGPLKNYLIDKSKQLNVEEQVIFFGSATREQVKLLYNSSDAFVLSSKYETFGVVLIEALSCGLPVIATKCGGPESIITNENVGELVAIDKEQIGKAMLKVYKNYQKYDREYIRKYAIDNFSNSVVVGKLIKIYEDVIS
ncbi:MAG TPA: glycosyltransferase, partial [Spirochaetia bacterium]|nr:glycosyltransferase [Spirochaetia bacterium]